jgi:hypothetical protein
MFMRASVVAAGVGSGLESSATGGLEVVSRTVADEPGPSPSE